MQKVSRIMPVQKMALKISKRISIDSKINLQEKPP